MCKMSPRPKWDWFDTLLVLIGLAGITLILSGGCTLRVERFQRPETELRAILTYQEYLNRERETDGTCPLKPVS